MDINNYCINENIIEQKEKIKIENGKLITEKYKKYDFSQKETSTKDKYKRGNKFILETIEKEYEN